MKFTLALVGAASASTETGIKMLQHLNTMDQSIENMQNVKTALVQCAAAGDCSVEAAAMPSLAMASGVDNRGISHTTELGACQQTIWPAAYRTSFWQDISNGATEGTCASAGYTVKGKTQVQHVGGATIEESVWHHADLAGPIVTHYIDTGACLQKTFPTGDSAGKALQYYKATKGTCASAGYPAMVYQTHHGEFGSVEGSEWHHADDAEPIVVYNIELGTCYQSIWPWAYETSAGGAIADGSTEGTCASAGYTVKSKTTFDHLDGGVTLEESVWHHADLAGPFVIHKLFNDGTENYVCLSISFPAAHKTSAGYALKHGYAEGTCASAGYTVKGKTTFDHHIGEATVDYVQWHHAGLLMI